MEGGRLVLTAIAEIFLKASANALSEYLIICYSEKGKSSNENSKYQLHDNKSLTGILTLLAATCSSNEALLVPGEFTEGSMTTSHS